MKKQHVRSMATAAIGLILGIMVAAVAFLMFSPDSTQDGAEPQPETQVETQVDAQPEAEEVSSGRLEDAEFVKAMPEKEQAQLIAIVCLATEKGNAPREVAESIANNFDAISEDYAQRFVSAALITVCSKISE